MFFVDRRDAGRQLAARLASFEGAEVVVLGLPRGGVPVAAEIAGALGAPLDVCLVRKLGVPRRPELAFGAIGEGGVRVVNDDVVRAYGISAEVLAGVEAEEQQILERRSRRYRSRREPVPLDGRTVLVVDDGVATGSTARVACRIARARGAERVVLAVPVAPRGLRERMAGDADELVTVQTPQEFAAIGQFYADFTQVTDEEVVACLGAADRGTRDRDVQVTAGGAVLDGHLTVPDDAAGIVVFAHGSGSSRHSPRNRFVADRLNRAGLGTLLFDLLTGEEETDRRNVFDTGMLGRRLADATGWLHEQPETADLPVGYFGASTGAAAALWAAAEPGADVAAVVSRGGRADMAESRLPEVTSPTLLIVGGDDDTVLRLNRAAEAQLTCEDDLAVVPGATHLFEEPGALEEVTELARDWFSAHMAAAGTR